MPPRKLRGPPVDRGPGRTPLAVIEETPPPGPLHFASGGMYDRTAETYHSLQKMLDGSAAAEAVAAVRARLEARDAAKAAAAAAAEESAAAEEAAKKPPPKKGKLSKEEEEAEAATEAAAAAQAQAEAQAEADAAAAQAEADAKELVAAGINWLDHIEDRALPYEWTPLLFAAARGEDRSVELLLAAGASVHVTDLYLSTPLHKAAQCGSVAKILASRICAHEAAPLSLQARPSTPGMRVLCIR